MRCTAVQGMLFRKLRVPLSLDCSKTKVFSNKTAVDSSLVWQLARKMFDSILLMHLTLSCVMDIAWNTMPSSKRSNAL